MLGETCTCGVGRTMGALIWGSDRIAGDADTYGRTTGTGDGNGRAMLGSGKGLAMTTGCGNGRNTGAG
jgi:hypothetical protein